VLAGRETAVATVTAKKGEQAMKQKTRNNRANLRDKGVSIDERTGF